MKRIGGALISIVLILAAVPVSSAFAAACSNVSSFGAVSLNLPEIKKTEDRSVWVRMQSPNQSDKILLELNERECFEVGGKDSVPNQWSWQTPANSISLDGSEGNTLKLIGINSGVRVDRVLLTEEGCVPQDFGNNCQKAVELTTYGPATTILPSPSDKPIGGKVVLSSTPEDNKSNLKELKYSVNGRTVQTSTTVVPFDTTLVENGKYNVLIQTVLNDGEIIYESTSLEIDNPENFLSPVVRFVRSNMLVIKKIAIVLLAVLAVLVVLKGLSMWRRSKRERSFHGF